MTDSRNETMLIQIQERLRLRGMTYVHVRESQSGTIDFSVFDPDNVGSGGYLFQMSTVLAGVKYANVVSEKNRFVSVLQGDTAGDLFLRFKSYVVKNHGGAWDHLDLVEKLPLFLVSEGYAA